MAALARFRVAWAKDPFATPSVADKYADRAATSAAMEICNSISTTLAQQN